MKKNSTKQSTTRQLSMFDKPAKKKRSVRSSTSKSGNPRKINVYGDRTVYYPKTKDNVKIAARQHGGKLRSGRK